MIKTHNLKSVVIEHNLFSFFHIRIQCDKCGNSRFRVYIIDPDGGVVYETIFKCQEFQIVDRVRDYIENQIGVNVPF